ncbi:MAG: LysR family transcriptional regulator substrate-binding protein, partial [Clostridia bacterium]|nr:LysR family transcriptional regulator substrate-binding protein [Clostridia bacterium]
FSDIYRGFITEYPDNKLEITEGGRNELIQKLSDNYIDMMFLPHNRSIDKNLATQKLMQLEIVCCASKNNPVSKIRAMRPMDLANIPLVLFKNSFFQTEKIKKWFAADNITPRILLQTEQLSTMQSVISNNIAVGFMFKQLVEERSDLVIIPLKIPMLVDVSLVWKKDAYTFKSMKDFREYIAKKFNILCQNNMHVNKHILYSKKYS